MGNQKVVQRDFIFVENIMEHDFFALFSCL